LILTTRGPSIIRNFLRLVAATQNQDTGDGGTANRPLGHVFPGRSTGRSPSA
jgi:hypothetical protein